MTSNGRGVYSYEELRRLFDPRSIAVVGASPSPSSFGARTLRNLARFNGAIFPINGKYQEIDGRRCWGSVAELPEAPDCVVVAVPRDGVEKVVLDAAARGAGGALIYASGYAETGREEHRALQARLAAIARESGMRIVGPNCMGMVNFTSRAVATFAVPARADTPTETAIGIVSQSGALAFALAQAAESGTSVSHVMMAGNACDVDVADQVAFLARDGGCRAIACLFEGMAEPRRFLEAAELASAAGMPLVIYKMATGRTGAAAAMSHTGSLAGSNDAYRAMFEKAGAIVVDAVEGLIEAAAFFAKAPAAPPAAKGIVALSMSGGAGIIAADCADRHGLALPRPAEPTLDVLNAHIPEFGAAANPIDLTAQAVNDPLALAVCTRALLSDPQYAAMALGFTSATEQNVGRIALYADAAKAEGKPICVVWLSQWQLGPGSREAESSRYVAMFRSMDRCMSTLSAWMARGRRESAAGQTETRISPPEAAAFAAKHMRAADGLVITEGAAKSLLAPYGIPVVAERLARTAQDAVAAASDIGFPVAIKVESVDLPHKTEAGVVRLGIRDEAELRQAYAEIVDKAMAASARVDGVLVQRMVPRGVEIIVGGRVDPQFGPLVLVGIGGTLVELMKDTAVGLAPVTPAQARGMIDALKGAAMLDGFRGQPAVDRAALADIVCRASEFLADNAALIAELDVNPLICAGGEIVAVDALIGLRRA
jgi:acetyl-CoA synthetase